MATVEDFKLRFPEFEDILDARVQLFLDDAALIMESPERWLTFYDVALCYHAAHLLYVSSFTDKGDGNSLGPVKKQDVDDVMVEQAIGTIAPTASDLHSSSYGKRYYLYIRMCFAGIVGV